jgi:hypothetical protein
LADGPPKGGDLRTTPILYFGGTIMSEHAPSTIAPLDNDEYLSIPQVAARLPGRPSACTIWRFRTKGFRGIRLTTTRCGGKIFVRRSDLETFLRAINGDGGADGPDAVAGVPSGDPPPLPPSRKDVEKRVRGAKESLRRNGFNNKNTKKREAAVGADA